MKYAVSNWIYGDEPLCTTFERLSRFGYDGIELVGEPSRYNIDEVRGLCQEFNITPVSVLGWSLASIPGRDSATPDAAGRATAQEYGRSCVDLAAAVGAPILVVIPAPAGRTAPLTAFQPDTWQAAYQAEWDYAVDSVRKLADYARSKNILLAIEPINRFESFLVTTTAQGLQFIKEVGADNVKLHLDTFHMNIDEADLPGAIRRAGDMLVNMHLSDSNREAPGRGHIDWGRILQALHDIHYTGALVMEPAPPGSDPILASKMSANLGLRDIYAEEGIRHLKQLSQKV